MCKKRHLTSKQRWKNASQTCSTRIVNADTFLRAWLRRSWSTSKKFTSRIYVTLSDSKGLIKVWQGQKILESLSPSNMAMHRLERPLPSALEVHLIILASSQSLENSVQVFPSFRENTGCSLKCTPFLTLEKAFKECHLSNFHFLNLKKVLFSQSTQFLAPTLKAKKFKRSKTMSVTKKLLISLKSILNLNIWSAETLEN